MIRGVMTLGRILSAVLLAALAAAGLAGYWQWWRGQIETGVLAWAEVQRARGYEVAFEGPGVAGFPLYLDTRLARPVLGSPGGWRWEGPALAGRMRLWDPRRLDVAFPGLHRLTRVGAAEADGTLVLRADGRLDALEALLYGLDLTAPEIGPAQAARLSLSLTPGYPEGPAAPVHFDISGEALDLALPTAARAALEPHAERLSLIGRLEGAFPDAEPRLALALWREAGGAFQIERLEATWAPLDLEATGRLSLDEQLRPLGDLQTRIAGLPRYLDRLAARGLMEPKQALAIKAAVLALSREEDGEGRAVVELPLSFRQGFLFLGPLRLTALSPVL
jgi:hypothetical protein